MLLRSRDLSELLELGQIALSCDSSSEFQQTSLRLLERRLGAESSLYVAIRQQESRWTFELGSSRGVPELGPSLWRQRYSKQDPFVRAFLQSPRQDGPIVVSDRIISHKKLSATEFYADFLRPQCVYHVLILGLISHDQPIGLFGLHRPPGSTPFSDKDVEKARLLSPYLTAAVLAAARSEESLCYRSAVDQIAGNSANRGVIVLDRLDNPLYSNSKADELLAPANGNCDATGADSQDVKAHVLDFCRQIESRENSGSDVKDDQHFQMKTSHSDLSVEVRRCKDGTRVVYLNEEINNSTIRKQRLKDYSLTNRQRTIAHLLSTGMTNPEIAERLHISIRTVQNHLRMIYNKVDVHNRTSLVNRLSYQTSFPDSFIG